MVQLIWTVVPEPEGVDDFMTARVRVGGMKV